MNSERFNLFQNFQGLNELFDIRNDQKKLTFILDQKTKKEHKIRYQDLQKDQQFRKKSSKNLEFTEKLRRIFGIHFACVFKSNQIYIPIINFKARFMIQTVRNTFDLCKQSISQLFNGTNKQNVNNPLQEVMQQPSIEQVMKSILIILKKKQHIIQNLCSVPDHQQIAEPFEYIFKNGGKRIRLVLGKILSNLAILINGLFRNELNDKVIQMGALIETLHTGSLIIDDIQDQSKSRRDKPCAHLVHGIRNSINAANLMYFLPFKKILASNFSEEEKAKMIEIYAKEMITCHLGQAEDVYSHKITKVQDLPSLDEYIRMTSAKTSSLFTMLIEMLSLVLKIDQATTSALINTMRYVGISFQITDDILNISDNLGKQQKAEDFHERKFTIIIHHLKNNKQFMKLFFSESKNSQTIQKMIQIVHQQKTIGFCQQIAYGYAEKALREIEKIKCPYNKSSFKALVKYVVERNK